MTVRSERPSARDNLAAAFGLIRNCGYAVRDHARRTLRRRRRDEGFLHHRPTRQVNAGTVPPRIAYAEIDEAKHPVERIAIAGYGQPYHAPQLRVGDQVLLGAEHVLQLIHIPDRSS